MFQVSVRILQVKLEQRNKLTVKTVMCRYESCVFCLFLDNAASILKPYKFKMNEIEGFRYRCRVSVLVTSGDVESY